VCARARIIFLYKTENEKIKCYLSESVVSLGPHKESAISIYIFLYSFFYLSESVVSFGPHKESAIVKRDLLVSKET